MRRVAFLLIAVAFLSPALHADQAENLARSGREALAAHDLDRAVGLLEKSVALNPRSADAHFWLGSAYGQQAQHASTFRQALLAKRTREQFEEAVKLDPRHQDARFGLIDFYLIAPGFMGGGEEKAYAQANELRKIDSLAGHRAWARIYSRQKKLELARKELLDAVREQPTSADAHYHLGVQYLVEKNYPAAGGMFAKAAALDPNDIATWFRIGQTAAYSGTNLQQGEEMLRKYLTAKPSFDQPPVARAHYWLGVILEKNGRKPEARQQFLLSLKLAPGAKDVSEALKRVS